MSLQGPHFFELKIIHMSKWHRLGRPVLTPFTARTAPGPRLLSEEGDPLPLHGRTFDNLA